MAITFALIPVSRVDGHSFGLSFSIRPAATGQHDKTNLAKVCSVLTSNGSAQDADADSIPDECESALAEKFAPIIYHSNFETNYPANVDWFLKRTQLKFQDSTCSPLPNEVINTPTQNDLVSQRFERLCSSAEPFISNGTRSKNKMRTFFLDDVPEQFRRGSDDSRDWYTYFHAYQNDVGGVTIQYWRFYSFNTGKTMEQGACDYVPGIWENLDNGPVGVTVKSMLAKVQVGYHGGDWEGIQVVLNGDEEPLVVRLMGHTQIGEVSWKTIPALSLQGNHLKIAAEPGGHASTIYDGTNSEKCIIQETWTGGLVRSEGKPPTQSGSLVNVGEKAHPLNKQVFIQYSGLWGKPSDINAILVIPSGTPNAIANLISEIRLRLYYASSGYWGPAFNETEMENDGFIKAWCGGRDPMPRTECYPTRMSP